MNFGRRDSPEHYSRLREALNAWRRALAAMAVAIGCAALGASGLSWALIPALMAAVFAVADALLAWQGYRAAEARELDGLLSGNVCRAAQARAVEYGVGVEALPAGEVWRYVQRDFDQDLREAIAAALSGTGPRLVILSGETKSGKTRSAFQLLSGEELNDAWLVVPSDGASVERLLCAGVLPKGWAPLVVWLDDLERYASVDSGGLHEGVLRNLECDRPVVLLATVGGRGSGSSDRASSLVEPIDQLRDLGTCIDVPIKLTPSELGRAELCYGRPLIEDIEQVGLGRRMVAMSKLREELKYSHEDCPEGFAIVRAMIDWRRAGAQRPLSADRLQLLYQHYLPDGLDPDQAIFASGLKWACKPLPSIRISLVRSALGATGYEPYDLAVEVASAEWAGLTDETLARIISVAEPLDCFQMAHTAFDAANSPLALDLLARAELSEDRRLSATSAFNAGVLLAEADDMGAAEGAYRRADARGSRRGAFNLGQMLRHGGDLKGAEVAYQKADERGSAEGAVNLGVLLERRGDLAGAEAAYRRSQQRGGRKGANNLERLLAERAQQSEPRSVLDRVEERRRVAT
jgi:tetratricopeptide (TPR) repeat protein